MAGEEGVLVVEITSLNSAYAKNIFVMYASDLYEIWLLHIGIIY